MAAITGGRTDSYRTCVMCNEEAEIIWGDRCDPCWAEIERRIQDREIGWRTNDGLTCP